jgi:hypothetical protein
MAATQYITQVRLEQTPGRPHMHIAAVKMYDGTTQSRQQVIANIRFGWATYYTYTATGIGAKVIPANCPHCGTHDYITTEPDTTVENNLLHLPRF